MRIANVHIKGFRNYIDEEIVLDQKTLIVGGNDAGKSNLLYALRILFDPSLSGRDLELSESDFNIQVGADEIIIDALVVDVTEPCLVSCFKDARRDEKILVRYRLAQGGSYELYVGPDKDGLTPCDSRFYLRYLNLEYVGGARDLGTFLRKQQNRLLDIAKDQRSPEEAAADDQSVSDIQNSLGALNDQISKLHYVRDSLNSINEAMENLSISNEGYSARLIAGNTDADKLLCNLRLAYLAGDSPLVFGGEGRGNQLYLATWLSEQHLPRLQEKVVFYAIEEPEAHLHPHQQRRLASYLSQSIDDQVLISTHSPQVAENFSGGRVLRLAPNGKCGSSVSYGCGEDVDAALEGLGYRLNSLSAEIFFCDGALLVEGPSERIFYSALCKSLGKDLDRYNVSILSVDGIGFEPYIRVCIALGIPFAMRTDNDVFKIPRKDEWHLAGIERVVGLSKILVNDLDLVAAIDAKSTKLRWSGSNEVPAESRAAANEIEAKLAPYGVFLSSCDLETDLAASPLANELFEQYGLQGCSEDQLIEIMKQRKAENMHRVIRTGINLASLESDPIVKPINYLLEQLESIRNDCNS